jgi:SAM-dependent methyltransferase
LIVAVDRWMGADDYEAYVGRWSRPVSDQFLEWLAIPAGRNWVDVGCGTGALSGAILSLAAPAAVVGVDPSPEFVAHASASLVHARVRFSVGSGSAVPVGNGWADVVVAGLVLNFIPDLPLALGELVRVAAPGAVIGGYVWDYAGEMQLIRRFWDAAVELDPAAVAKDEGVRFTICAPEPLQKAFEAAGLEDVSVRSIDIATVFTDFDDYWRPFLSGVGPAPGYAVALGEPSRTRLRERLRATLPFEPDGSIHLVARAWAVRGRTPRASR